MNKEADDPYKYMKMHKSEQMIQGTADQKVNHQHVKGKDFGKLAAANSLEYVLLGKLDTTNDMDNETAAINKNFRVPTTPGSVFGGSRNLLKKNNNKKTATNSTI